MKNKETFIAIDKADDNKPDVVNVMVKDKDGNLIVSVGTFEPNLKGVYYEEDALRKMVERSIEEGRKNKDILELNKYGARKLYIDEVNKTKSVPHYLIEDFIACDGESNLKVVLKQNRGNDKMEFRSMESVIEEITKHRILKSFVSNIVDAYEQSKYENFYTKGIIYDSVDREISSSVINSILSSDFECVVKDNSSVELIMNDVYTTRIRVTIDESQISLNVNARGVFCPKINKQAMELVALTIFNKLSN